MVANSRVPVLLALQTLKLICLGTVLDRDLLDAADLQMTMTVVAHRVAATALVATVTVTDLLVETIMMIAEAVVGTDPPPVLVDLLKTIRLRVAAVAMKKLTVGTILRLIRTSTVLLEPMSVAPHVTTLLEILDMLVTTTVVTNFNL